MAGLSGSNYQRYADMKELHTSFNGILEIGGAVIGGFVVFEIC